MLKGAKFKACTSRSLFVKLVTLLLVLTPARGQRKTLTLGAVITRYPDSMNRRNDGWGYENTGSAIQIAVEKFQAAGGLIGGMEIKIVRVDDACSAKIGIHVLLKLHAEINPDVVLGPSCSSIIKVMGLVMSYWRLPFWPYGGTEPSLEDKVTQDVMVRIHATGSKIGTAFHQVFEQYGWKRVVMLTSVTYCDMGARGISNEFNKRGILIAEWIQTLSQKIETAAIDDFLDRLRLRGRIFIVCFDHWGSQQRFFERAEAKGMATPEYVYFFYTIRDAINQRIKEPWLFERTLSTAAAQRASKPYVFYKQITLTTLSGEAIEEFYAEVPKKLAEPPISYNESILNGYQGSWQAVNLHDATLTYLTVVNETIKDGQDYKDGTILYKRMVNRRIEGMQLQSPLRYDSHADRVPNFWVWSYSPMQTQFEIAIEMVMTNKPEDRMQKKFDIYWGTEDGMPPPDTPVCGFRNELCVVEEDSNTALIIGASVAAVASIIIVVVAAVLIRHRQKESALRLMLWKISFEELEIANQKKSGRESSQNGSTRMNGSSRSIHSKSASRAEDPPEVKLGAKVGYYKGMQVTIYFVDRDHIFLERAGLMELKTMRELKHDNLDSFIGACTDPPNVCYVMSYCSQGSLQDILMNEQTKLDWPFKMSFISDLVHGMAYLHKSELISHGQLKSNNCLVDQRWVLKISDYGLKYFKDLGSSKDKSEYEQYREQLWTAPELLRLPHKPQYGTQKGDVYSFSIILQEIVYRSMPFFLEEGKPPKEIVQKVSRGVEPPFRPKLKELTDDTNHAVLDLMLICWYEDPNERPDFETCRKKVLALNNGKKIDMMANILDKLEKYTGNLEEVVNQRTQEVIEEKKKTDLLLYSMMPQSVAEQLKTGKNKVEPILYNETTVYFSDVIGFTALSAESTPLELVNFLNDLYTLFDDIIFQHDVYKVETIGDAYMVVSGLPNVNGNKHIGEIANLSLDLMSAVFTRFRARHRPNWKVQLRIGMHSGQCAAGIVGLTMPRYCLFGDTVNTASRLESNGEASKIHVSQASYEALQTMGGYTTAIRGKMELKGKGLQTTYWLTGKHGYSKPLPPLS